MSFPISLFPLNGQSVVFGHEFGSAELRRQSLSPGGCEKLITQYIVSTQAENMLPVVFFAFSSEHAYFRGVQKKRALSTGISSEKCCLCRSAFLGKSVPQKPEEGKNAVDRLPPL
jgi:hypothetical protein